MAAIGVNGRWVLIQFKTATLDTGDQWTLTDLIWGVNETQHLLGTTVAGDTFVLLTGSGLLRIPETAANIGVSKEPKVVTCGQSVDAVAPFSFTTWGLSYLRPCPSTVLSASITDPPEDADDGDAYLLPNDTSLSGVWAEHGGEIAHWSDETDNWVYCTPAPGTIIHIESDTSDSSDSGEDVISVGDGTYTPPTWPPADANYLTHQDESADLPNSLRLLPGTNVTFDTDTGNTLTINATSDTTATYVTQADESATLPNSFRLVEGDNILLSTTPATTRSRFTVKRATAAEPAAAMVTSLTHDLGAVVRDRTSSPTTRMSGRSSRRTVPP